MPKFIGLTQDDPKLEKPTKDETYWKILNAAVALDIQKGHQKWTITQLSKKSGISRALIYYYFGSSKVDLLKEAISTIGYEMAGISQDRLELWSHGKIAESFMVTHKILKENPALLHLSLSQKYKIVDL